MTDSKTAENPSASSPVESPSSQAAVSRSKLPDFRPLGTIRDYFTEQMKQDAIR